MTFLRSADNYGGQKPSHDIAVPVAISDKSQGIPATGGSETRLHRLANGGDALE